MKICLLALTGFGNTILEELMSIPVIDHIVVFTREEKGEFPYYDCEHLLDLCNRMCVETYINNEMVPQLIYEELRRFKPDMILVATFDQKIPQRIIDIPKMGMINIHPSLLPKYRGPMPTHWSIINGESESGVTYHAMSSEFDMGDILLQERTSIGGVVDGELRRKLAKLSSKMLQSFLRKYRNSELNSKVQSKNEGTYYPKVTSKRGIALLKSGQFNRANVIRGLTPYPGIGILR